MSLWKKPVDLDAIRAQCKNTLIELLGISELEVGEDYLKGSMPVDSRHHQPIGILHGGASVVLAESLGSLAGNLACDQDHYCVGLEVNANHLSKVKEGLVVATTRPVHIGRSTQVWDIRVNTEDGKPVCISRLTLAVLRQQ